jgi:hypothetical protein
MMALPRLKIKRLYALSAENKRFCFPQPLKHSIRIGNREYEVKLKSDEKFGTYILWENRNIPLRSSGRVRINMRSFLMI